MSSIMIKNTNELNIRSELFLGFENHLNEMIKKSVRLCGERYGFDGNKACEELDLCGIHLTMKDSIKKVNVNKLKSSTSSVRIPLPFVSDGVDASLCQGLQYNRGLYTQCSKVRMDSGDYCVGCQKLSDDSSTSIPPNGNVSQRLNVGLYEYKDNKGRRPVAYKKVLSDMNISESEALKFAGDLDISEHLQYDIPCPEVKKRGRPKKSKTVIESTSEGGDMFANLIETESSSDNVVINDGMIMETVGDAVFELVSNVAENVEKAAEKEAKAAEKVGY